MYYLIYLLFGKDNDGLRSEMIYSLLSYQKIAGEWSTENIKILIYTDEAFGLPLCLEGLPVIFSYLNPQDVSDWIKRGNGLRMIVKAMIMQNFLETTGSNGILIDTDTFFVRDPSPLFKTVGQGYPLMHLQEYPIKFKPALHSFFSKMEFKGINGLEYRVDPSFHMWNAGVVGVSIWYLKIMPEIISLIEQISGQEEWPVTEFRLIEQTSYSYYLQKQKNKLMPAEGYIVHYWFFKQFRYLLGNHFDLFYGRDRDHFTAILDEYGLKEQEIAAFDHGNLPSLMFALMKKFDAVRNVHFECLPEGTYIGSVLRNGN